MTRITNRNDKIFLHDALLYTLLTLPSRGLGIVLSPLYISVLTPGDFGSLDLLTAFSGIVNLTISLEVSQGLARFYSSETDSGRRVSYASTALWFTLGCYSE